MQGGGYAFWAAAKFVDAAPGSSGVKPIGITGLVYGGIKGITRLAGGTVNAALTKAALFVTQRFGTPASSPERKAVLSIINGVLGDQLLVTANPLSISISMRLRCDGKPLMVEKAAISQRLPHATGKLLVVLYGLCINDLQWTTGGYNHADVLAKELGYTPVYLHYNTGCTRQSMASSLPRCLRNCLMVGRSPLKT